MQETAYQHANGVQKSAAEQKEFIEAEKAKIIDEAVKEVGNG